MARNKAMRVANCIVALVSLSPREVLIKFLFVIPAKAGLRRRDAEANIRVANGPKGVQQEPHVIQSLPYLAEALDPGLRRDDGLFRWSLGISIFAR